MLSTDQSVGLRLPELPYGSVWLVGAADGDLRHLSPLAVHALSTADAVIHDPGISKAVLDLVRPPQYREAAEPSLATERVIKLAEDGWRIVQLVKGNAMERAVESAIRCAERNILFRIVPNSGDPVGMEAPLGLLMVRKTLSVGGAEPQPTLVLFIASPQIGRGGRGRLTPATAGFSMSGLAG